MLTFAQQMLEERNMTYTEINPVSIMTIVLFILFIKFK
jgi:hypothetical protein